MMEGPSALTTSFRSVPHSERIPPDSEGSPEITPLKTRRARGAPAAVPERVQPEESDFVRSPEVLREQAAKRAAEFQRLEVRRELPSKLMSSQDAVLVLLDNYNVTVMQQDGHDCYRVPTVELAEGRAPRPGCDHFATVQDLRENLCAFGLPPRLAEGTRAGEAARRRELEAWIRGAHLGALCDERPVAVPHVAAPQQKEARDILKGLGYLFCDNFNIVVSPGTSCHTSKPGTTQFDTLIGLFNHLARFGLETDVVKSKRSVSDEEILKLEVFVASVATTDVW